MYRSCKLNLSFDVVRLQTDLAMATQAAWIPHFVPGNYEGDWSAIPLRSVEGQIEHIFSDPSVAVSTYRNTPVMKECPYFCQVLGAFDCPITSVRLLKLAAGSLIKEHVDHDLTVKNGVVRLHIPIVTNPDVEFYIEDERVRMAAGECWYIDASLPHRLANKGGTNRVHIVLDCVVNDWLNNWLIEAGYRPRPLTFLETRGVRPQDLDKVIAALIAMGTETSLAHARELEAARR